MPTTHEPAQTPAWPVYDLTVHDDGRVLASGPLISTSGHATRAFAVAAVAGVAARLGRPVRARATEPDGTVWHLTISPDAQVNELPGGGPRTPAPKKRQPKRPAEAVASGPVPPISGAFPPGSGVRTAPEAGPDALSRVAESLSEVADHLEAGRVDQALALATRLDEQAAGVFGVSHPQSLSIREIRAQVTALAGQEIGGIRLYRDVAERWHYLGDGERAEAVASRAQRLWLRIPHPDQALTAADDVIRMRNQIPGAGSQALTAVLEHRAQLRRTQDTSGPETPARPVPHTPAPRAPRQARTWERPAVRARTAG